MPEPIYRIRNWPKHFENNRTRELKSMAWVPFPTKHDGDGYTELLDHEDGCLHFGAWCLIVQVAARCDPRGTLLRDGGRPHDPASLARMTRAPASAFEAVIPRLLTIGWLEACEIPQEGAAESQDDASASQVARARDTERNDTERKTEQNTERQDRAAPHLQGNGYRPWVQGRSAEWDRCLEIMQALELDEQARDRLSTSSLDDMALCRLLSDMRGKRSMRKPSAYVVSELKRLENGG